MTPDPSRADPSLLENLERVISSELVTPVFQPIVDVRTGTTAAYESLTRPLPGSGFADAGALFDAADAAGRLWEVERVTRRASLDAATSWPAGISLFLNCSPSVFADPRFPGTLAAEIRQRSSLPPGRIVIEVTERTAHSFDAALIANVAKVREIGCPVAIDDVGAGTSGLNRIMQIHPQWLKLDRELIDGIDRNPVAQNLVKFIFNFARMSGVSLIAEGVERERDLETLMAMGISFAQGYLLGRPVPREGLGSHEATGMLRPLIERTRWLRFQDPRSARLHQIGRGIVVADRASPLRQVVDDASALRDVSIVVITEATRVVGWTSLVSVAAAAPEEPGLPVMAVSRGVPQTLDGGATVIDALDLASSRPEQSLSEPIVITEGAEPIAAISPRELIRLAARVCEGVERRTAPITGLPGRVRCEQHLRQRLESRETAGTDVAFVDLRNFAAYNEAFGFELGDHVIRALAGVVLGAVEETRVESCFVGHIGDERFLVVAPGTIMPGAMRRVAERFGGEVRHVESAARRRTAGTGLTVEAPAVRVLVYRDALSLLPGVREVMRSEQLLRRLADDEAALRPDGGSTVFFYDPGERADGLNAA